MARDLFAVDQVGAEQRAATLAKRSIQQEVQGRGTRAGGVGDGPHHPRGADTVGKVEALCAKARRPDPADPSVPPVAAVCIYPSLVPTAKRELTGSPVKGCR